MIHSVKSKISIFVFFLCAGAVAITFAGSPVFALESYEFVTKWGSSGSGDGQFNNPEGIDNYDKTLYVTDRNNNRVQKFTLDGYFLSKFGSSGSGDGQLNHPAGIFCDVGNSRVYVADRDNNRIQKLSTTGSFVLAIGSSGSGDGEFSHPMSAAKMPGIGGDYQYKIYVTDTDNNRIQLFTTDGDFFGKWGTSGSQNGELNSPRGIAINNTGSVYVADYNNNRIQKFNPDGSFVSAWGSFGSANGQFNGPYYIAIDNNDNGAVYVTDSNNHRVQKFTADGGFVGAWGSQGSGDGQFNVPKGVCVYRQAAASVGYVFVVDSGNNRIQKFQVTIGAGTTTTVQASSTTTSLNTTTTSPGSSTTSIPGGTTTTIPGGATTTISGSTTIPGNTTTTVPGGTSTTIPGGTTTTISGGSTTTMFPGQVVADFSASPTEGYRPLTVNFLNLSRGDIVTYLWNFGDGQESSQKDPVHTYKKRGTYSVILKVFGNNGTQDTKSKDSYIVVKSRCIFIQSLENTEAIETIALLRNILFNNPCGAYLAGMYYQNADEISDILEQDPALQEKFKDLVRKNLAAAEERILAGEAVVSAKEIEEVIAFLYEVQTKGSLKLQMDTNVIITGIQKGHLLQGMGITVD
jgi:PKD repeat protein/sugar lactone lactonase YvrE